MNARRGRRHHLHEQHDVVVPARLAVLGALGAGLEMIEDAGRLRGRRRGNQKDAAAERGEEGNNAMHEASVCVTV
jgi:hypothetical protein